MFERHEMEHAFSRACAKTGNRIAARITIMAITTRSSIRVKPRRLWFLGLPPQARGPTGCGAGCGQAKAETATCGPLTPGGRDARVVGSDQRSGQAGCGGGVGGWGAAEGGAGDGAKRTAMLTGSAATPMLGG